MKAIIFFILIPCFMLLCSCKVTYSLVDQDFPIYWKTFSLENIDVSAPAAPANFSIQLTELIKDGLLDRTRLELNPEGDGDIQLSANVINYSISPQAIQANEVAAQNRLTITIKMNMVTKKENGELQLHPQFNISRFAVYDSNQDITAVENLLVEEINNQFVQDIINKLNSSS